MFSPQARKKIKKMGYDPDEVIARLEAEGYRKQQGKGANVCEFCGGACERRYYKRWFCPKHQARGRALVDRDRRYVNNPTLGFLSRNP